MTDKKKIQDKRIWNRLGFELTVLCDLLVEMRVDMDYQGILPQNMFTPLDQAADKLRFMRAKAEDRMWNMTPFHALHVFYPYTGEKDVTGTIKAIRQMIKEAANEANHLPD